MQNQNDRILVPVSWRTAFAVARIFLALVLLLVELYPLWYPPTPLGLLYAVYALFALYCLRWQRRDEGRGDLVRLILDLAVLLVTISIPPDRTGWGAALLFAYVLTSACLLHRIREVAVVVLAALGFHAAMPAENASLGPLLLAPGLIALLLAWQRSLLEERLFHASRQSVHYRSEAENARELERQRIAADFHDGPLQSFISFQMRLEVIKKLIDRNKEAAISDLVQLQEICRKQITDMRTFVRSMRMSQDGAPPAVSMRQIADDFQKTSGTQLQWNVGEALSGLEPEISHEVFQIIREALHNVQKHSKASKVSLSAEKKEGSIYLAVDDDGSGFPFGGTYNLEELELMRMGPESIKRRVRTLSGELVVESRPGQGAALRIRIPL